MTQLSTAPPFFLYKATGKNRGLIPNVHEGRVPFLIRMSSTQMGSDLSDTLFYGDRTVGVNLYAIRRALHEAHVGSVMCSA